MWECAERARSTLAICKRPSGHFRPCLSCLSSVLLLRCQVSVPLLLRPALWMWYFMVFHGNPSPMATASASLWQAFLRVWLQPCWLLSVLSVEIVEILLALPKGRGSRDAKSIKSQPCCCGLEVSLPVAVILGTIIQVLRGLLVASCLECPS